MSENILPKSHFKTNVLLKSILGKDLINNDNVAVLELVKNSYDAGSKIVNIYFKNLKKNDDDAIEGITRISSMLIIEDIGIGMNEEDVVDKWLNIAYSDKKYKKESRGRIVAGSKGIGRFSCDRLGKYLNMYTKRENESKYIHLFIDWTKFEIEEQKDLQIQEIPVKLDFIDEKIFESKTGYKSFKSGTILEIAKLRNKWIFVEKFKNLGKIDERWNTESLISLKRYLERLINPYQLDDKKMDFSIYIHAHELLKKDEKKKKKLKEDEIINGKIENKIFEKLNFKTTYILSNIKIDKSLKLLSTKLFDKGRVIYEIVEDITNFSEYEFINNSNIIIYYLNTYAKYYFTKQMGVRPKDFGSIFLFKNGFRIPPYGDEDNDWLGLEVRKGQGQRRFLGARDIVGRIEIYDRENVFREVSSREGLVENKAYKNLTSNLFYLVLKRLEKFVIEGLNWDSIPKELRNSIGKKEHDFTEEIFSLSQEEKDKKSIDAISSLIKTRNANILKIKVNSDLITSLAYEEKEKFDKIYSDFESYGLTKLDKNLALKLEDISILLRKKDQEIQFLKEKAFVSDSDILFDNEKKIEPVNEVKALQHHINQSTERILKHLDVLKNCILKKESSDILLELVNRIYFENQKISTIANFITRAKFNMMTDEINKDLVNFIREYIQNVYVNYPDKIINKKLINVLIFTNPSLEFKTRFKPIDFVIIIDNFLDNAVKAHAKRMEIYIEKKENNLQLRFKDDGDGIDKKIKDINLIFDFGFSTRERGTGIGLFHVKSIIDEMGGTIKVNTDIKNGTEFIIKLKK
jgi:signal transduction histidine kinase